MKKKYSPANQQWIIDGLRANDSAVLANLYRANFPKIMALVAKDGGTRAQADDIMQEAIIVVWNKVREKSFVPHGETAIDGYLFRVAKNKWLDLLRSFHHTKMTPLNAIAEIQNTDYLYYRTGDNGPHDEERLQIALTAFGRMDENCASILKKFYYEKKTMDEIAHELEINPVSIRNRKYLCLKKLRKLFLTMEGSDDGE
ncbi:MAG: sigma-70 family RNA polymerase sigma factor [Allomuricauda sp.]